MSNVRPTAAFRNVFHVLPATPADLERFRMPPSFQLVRDVVLPRAGDTLSQVRAVEMHYERVTGRVLATYEAIRLLDQIKADRPTTDPYDPRPIAEALLPVAEFMAKEQYDRDSIYLTCRELERTGDVTRCVGLDGDDRQVVESLIPVGFMAAKGSRFECFA